MASYMTKDELFPFLEVVPTPLPNQTILRSLKSVYHIKLSRVLCGLIARGIQLMLNGNNLHVTN